MILAALNIMILYLGELIVFAGILTANALAAITVAYIVHLYLQQRGNWNELKLEVHRWRR